jgi:hypothetical protein
MIQVEAQRRQAVCSLELVVSGMASLRSRHCSETSLREARESSLLARIATLEETNNSLEAARLVNGSPKNISLETRMSEAVASLAAGLEKEKRSGLALRVELTKLVAEKEMPSQLREERALSAKQRRGRVPENAPAFVSHDDALELHRRTCLLEGELMSTRKQMEVTHLIPHGTSQSSKITSNVWSQASQAASEADLGKCFAYISELEAKLQAFFPPPPSPPRRRSRTQLSD